MSETEKTDLSGFNLPASCSSSNPSSGMSSKKKVLTEWRKETSPSPLLNKPSKNLPPKMGISQFSSKCNDVNLDDENFVPDLSSMSYDPLTNYLSPRPKFRLYNPNRRREAMVVRQVEDRSHHSHCYFPAEMGGNVVSEKDEEVDMETGKGKSGFKWELVKCFIVVIVLVLFTMYISSMNQTPQVMNSGIKVKYQEFGVNSLKAVTLNVQVVKWVLDDMREKGMLEFRKTKSYNQSNDGMLEDETSTDYEPNELESVDEAPSHQEIEAEELEFEMKYMYDQLEDEEEDLSEDEEEPELEVEDGDEQRWINLKSVLVFTIPLLMIWVVYLVVEFYFKCKKASIASNVELSTKSTKKISLSRLGRMTKQN